MITNKLPEILCEDDCKDYTLHAAIASGVLSILAAVVPELFRSARESMERRQELERENSELKLMLHKLEVENDGHEEEA